MTTSESSPRANVETLDALEALVASDPGDDDLRRRYVETAVALGDPRRAAEALKGAIGRRRSSLVRERVGFDVAMLYLKDGELGSARQSLLDVVVAGAGGPSSVAAARRLLELEGEPGNARILEVALEAVAKLSPDGEERHEAAARLLSMHAGSPLKPARLAAAYEALVDSPRASEALSWLRTFYEKKRDRNGLSEVYRTLAVRAADSEKGRAFALESIRLANDPGPDKSAERWLWFLERFGPDREAHRHLAPLLEETDRYDDLRRVLESDAEIAPPEERAPILARLGEILLAKLGDAGAALGAFRRCLASDPDNHVARRAAERLMGVGDHRLDAAAILEPLYEREGHLLGQLSVLETRAHLLPDPASRLAALAKGIQVATAAHLPDRAVPLCRLAMELDPSSPDLQRRYDQLVGGSEPSGARLARYESALERTADPARRSSLLHTIAAIRHGAGDVRGAMEAWRQVIAHAPADAVAFERLLDATMDLREDDAVLALFDRACGSVGDRERPRIVLKKAVWLAGHGGGDAAIELCRQVVDQGLGPSQLRAIVEIARDAGDDLLQRHALELLAASDDAHASSQALEQLGDFQYERLGDRCAAASSWKAAAQAVGEADPEHAQSLYERALETLPGDLAAAERLIDLYAIAGAWVRLLDALRLFIRSGDPGRAAACLLRFQDSVLEAGAADEFLALADELVAQVGPDDPAWLTEIKRARSRVLLADPGRQAEASEALKELIESWGEQDDVQALEALVAGNPSATERHRQRRWLYRWRETHSADPTEVLVECARAELEYGDPEAARIAYEKVAALHPGHRDALEAVCRLRFRAGELEGALAALEELRGHVGDDEGRSLALSVAEWLWGELGRPGEAAEVLARLLAIDPPDVAARALGGKMLGDLAARAETIERLEAIANAAPADAARHILAFLVAAREETDGLRGPRLRWFERVVELSHDTPRTALSYALQGVLEMPEALALWDVAEAAALHLGCPELVAQAYRRVFVEGAIPPDLAAKLGPRMVAFEDGCTIEPGASVEALLRVLDAIPGARWALDRVKFVLGSAARYGELFGLYDRAVLAVSNDNERADLLSEAAFAARDLAGDPKRAVQYFEFLRILRPDDAAVDGALERLYERQGLKRKLVGLLARRAERTTSFRLRELEQRIATLWLELGETSSADAVVQRMLATGVDVADVVDLLEHIAQPPAPTSDEAHAAAERAIERLRAHYRDRGQNDDLARVAEMALGLARGPRVRELCARRWVDALLVNAKAPHAFESVFDQARSRIGGDAVLALVIYKVLLIRAIHTWRRDASSEASADAQSAAYRITETLATLLVQEVRPAAASRLLYRSSRLPFPPPRRRQLLGKAAFVCADVAGGARRAIALFDELFEQDASDELAANAIVRFAELLDAAGEHAKLASRWEQQAQVRARAGNAATACDGWERAASIWEKHGEIDRAVAAYRQGAALASRASFEALARIQLGRNEWRDAAGALEWLIARARDAERHVRTLELADVYTRLGESDRARACLEQALPSAADTGHGEQVRERLIALYRRDGVYEPLARLLAAEALRVDVLPRKLALVREACDILQTKLGEPEEATSLLKLSLTWAPGDEGLSQWLLEALESLERWDEAAGVLREKVAGFGQQRSKERALTHHRLARALVRANRMAEALVELRTAAGMFPGHASILHDLARVALDSGEVDFAEATYRALLFALPRSTRAEEADGAPRRSDVLLDLAEIALRKGDDERGAELVDSAFDDALEGDTDLSRLEQALAARGRHELLARQEERCVERGATLAQRALALGRWVDLWAQRLGNAPEAAARIRQHVRRIARDVEQETLADPSAWAALCSVHRVLPDEETRDRLATSLGSAIVAVKDRGDRGLLRVGLARLLLEEPPRNAAAIEALEGALADDPNDAEALDLLSDALEREGRFDDLATVLERCVQPLAWEEHTPALAATEWRLAQALEKAGRPQDALDRYEAMLDRDPDRDLVAALAARLEALSSERLADCLERWMALDATAAPRVHKRLVELRGQCGDRAGVARALEAAFAVEPGNADLRDRLVAHYEQQGQWAQAAGALRRAVDATPKQRGLLLRLIEAYRRAGAHEDLLRALDAALATRPRDAEVLALRAKEREDRGDIDGAVADLESACSVDAKRLGALLDLLARVVAQETAHVTDDHFLRMAEILTRLNRPKEARALLERLRARNPNHREALRKLALAACAEQDWGAAAENYRELMRLVDGETDEEVLRVTSAFVDACQRAGRVGEARGPVARVFDKLARSPAFWPDLERLCETTGDWGRLADLLVRGAEQQPIGDDQKATLLTRAARLWLEQGADPARALRAVEQARSVAPGSTEILLVWARVQVALGRPREALAALDDVVTRNRLAGPALATVCLEMAKAHLSVDALVEAWNALKSGFSADSRHGEIAMMLGLLSLDMEDEKTAERALTAVTKVSTRGDGASKALAFYHLARMAYAKAEVVKARLLATKAVDSDPRHRGARRLLERLGAVPAHRL